MLYRAQKTLVMLEYMRPNEWDPFNCPNKLNVDSANISKQILQKMWINKIHAIVIISLPEKLPPIVGK